jgi:hypothetical protein
MDRRMNAPSQNRAARAGGFLLAASILVGAIAGSILHQPSIGFLVGTGVGLFLLALVWLIDRRR